MAIPSLQESEFVDRIGLFFELLGGSRTMGRVYGWLMICPGPHASITEIATALSISKASVSTVIRQMEQGQMVERAPVANSRQHHYQPRAGGWAQIVRGRLARMRLGSDAAEYGLSVIGAERPLARERMHELRDFLTFTEEMYGEEYVRRWEEYRKRRHDERAVAHESPTDRMSTSHAAARKTDSDPPA